MGMDAHETQSTTCSFYTPNCPSLSSCSVLSSAALCLPSAQHYFFLWFWINLSWRQWMMMRGRWFLHCSKKSVPARASGFSAVLRDKDHESPDASRRRRRFGVSCVSAPEDTQIECP